MWLDVSVKVELGPVTLVSKRSQNVAEPRAGNERESGENWEESESERSQYETSREYS